MEDTSGGSTTGTDSGGSTTTTTTDGGSTIGGVTLAKGVYASSGSPSGYFDANGAPVNADGTVFDQTSTNTGGSGTTTTGTSTAGTNTSSSNGLAGTWAGNLLSSLGIPIGSGSLGSILSSNSGALTGLAALAALTSSNTPTTAGYQGSIPNLNAIRSQVPASQAVNGVAMGQNYFTPVQYVNQSDAAANTAARTADQQNQYNMAVQNYANQAPAPSPQPAMATPWIAAQQAQQQRMNNQMNAQSAPASSVTSVYPLPAAGNVPQIPGTQPVAAPQGGLMSFDDGGQVPDGTVVWSPMQLSKPSQPQVNLASGGIAGYADGGMRQPTYLQGTTDGMADKIPTTIDGKEPALLSHGEFVIPADVVSHLGNGNSDAGAEQLYKMMDRIREARTGNKEQGKRINPDKFTPGGIAGYATGGGIKHYDGTATSAVTSNAATAGNTTGASSSNTLSPYVGQYVTNMLGQGQALANQPMPVYQGQLTAGPSALQNQQFSDLSQLAQTGLTPTNFQSGTFDANAAAQYMNPYLQASLDPQLAALQRQSAINEQGDLSKLTQAGAYGGSRQAVLQGQDQYNLLSQQANLIGQGYNTAYNNAMNQFNTANAQSLQAQQNQEAANEAAANYGLSTLNALGQAGATQQGLNQAADTAQLNQFNQQMNYPYAQVQFEQGLLNGLPVTTTATTPNQTTLGNILNTVGGLGSLNTQLSGLAGSTGTTSGGSQGTTTNSSGG